MIAFLDFEASSLADRSYPIELAWVFEDGCEETHLIRPAPDWQDWDARAEAIHRIPREKLLDEGEPHEAVAARAVAALTGHALFASAPSWDGKWLSVLLRAAGLPRKTLRLRASGDAFREAAMAELAPVLPATELESTVVALVAEQELRDAPLQPAHRALADAREEYRAWLRVRAAALALAAART